MTPMEQLDIIKGCQTVESMDEEDPSPRDLEVGFFFYREIGFVYIP